MKILINYEPLTGNITSDTGLVVATYVGLNHLEHKEKEVSSTVDDLIKLKNSGFTAEEVIEIKKADLI